MKSDLKFNIEEFPKQPDDDFLNSIYDLNQLNTPEVGSLDSIEYFKNLLILSSKNLFVLLGNEIVGFIVCFREGSSYSSLNYKFLIKSKFKRVIYSINDIDKRTSNKAYSLLRSKKIKVPESIIGDL